MRKVIIYTTPTCGYCHMAKQYFNENGIEYTEFDVSSDQAKAEEMVTKSGQMGVPVIQIDERLIIGFDKAAIAPLLDLN